MYLCRGETEWKTCWVISTTWAWSPIRPYWLWNSSSKQPLIHCFKRIISAVSSPDSIEACRFILEAERYLRWFCISSLLFSFLYSLSPINLNRSQRPCPHNGAGIALPCTPQLESLGAHISSPNIKIEPLPITSFLLKRHPNAQGGKELGWVQTASPGCQTRGLEMLDTSTHSTGPGNSLRCCPSTC